MLKLCRMKRRGSGTLEISMHIIIHDASELSVCWVPYSKFYSLALGSTPLPCQNNDFARGERKKEIGRGPCHYKIYYSSLHGSSVKEKSSCIYKVYIFAHVHTTAFPISSTKVLW